MYTYSLNFHFKGLINLDNLKYEILYSNIKQKLKNIVVYGDVVTIEFYNYLDADDNLLLTELVAKHDSSTPNKIQQVIFPAPQLTTVKPTNIGDRLWFFTHDFCDKTTWSQGSTLVEDEQFAGDGVQTVFQLAHTHIIDLAHGRISDEDKISTPDGGNYLVKVKVDDVLKTEREFGEDSGGDYTLNYTTGALTFFTAPSGAIEVTYYYAGESTQKIIPTPGTQFELFQVELQFSKDLDLTDEVDIGIFTYNPSLGAPPEKFVYPPSFARFKRIYDFINWSRGAFPIIPIFGGSVRGSAQELLHLRVDYISPVVLKSSQGAELRIWTKHHRELGGEFATVTCYGVCNNE